MRSSLRVSPLVAVLLLSSVAAAQEPAPADSVVLLAPAEVRAEWTAALQLELTPKDPRLRNQIHKLHLWIDLASWLPVQQKFFEVGGDYFETKYTEQKINAPIPGSKQRLSAPRNTKVVKPRAGM